MLTTYDCEGVEPHAMLVVQVGQIVSP